MNTVFIILFITWPWHEIQDEGKSADLSVPSSAVLAYLKFIVHTNLELQNE